ncbi:MAG: IPT/TIG domain-containing protein [Gaiellaceae bacterium]
MVSAVTVPDAEPAPLSNKLVPSYGALWGIAVQGRDGRDAVQEVAYLEGVIQRRYDMQRRYYRWDEPFPGAEETAALSAGRIPVISWNAKTIAQVPVKWADIASGAHDGLINTRADAVKALGKPVMMVFNHEPENDIGSTKRGTPADFTAAWRRIVTMFRARGATNTVWVWNLMAFSFQTNSGRNPLDYYPGDDVVDWMAADGYNWFGSTHVLNQPWRSFASIFQPFYDWGKTRGKPLAVFETGVLDDTKTPDPNRKAQWFRDLLTTMKSWPAMKGIIYFNGSGWHFDSSVAATNAYRAVGLDPWLNPQAVPAISSFSPTSGAAGSTVVTINGTNFTGTAAVRFNGKPASFSVVFATQIRATVPNGATTGRISVTSPTGTGTSATNFTVSYTVSSFSPTSGPTGTIVTVTGNGFTNPSTVKFNGVSATTTYVSPSQLRATVPASAATGTITVVRSTAPTTTQSATPYTVTPFVAPTISGFTPTSGLAGARVRINGAYFSGAGAVKFNGVSAAYTIVSATQIDAVVPAGATTGKISVTTPAGTATSTGTFTALAITSFTPTSGLAGTVVTINGSGFTTTSTVKFNGVAATVTYVSPTQLKGTLPAGATTGKITVTNAAAPVGTVTSAATFTALAITSFTPTSGPAGTVVTINGSGFTTTSTVKFNGVVATKTYVSPTQLKATVPATATAGKISVTNTAAPVGTVTSAAVFTKT